jgi:cellulose synthase/poly-beta-1,6-N-acetylglucosamine synthase-like glycosyltransferase
MDSTARTATEPSPSITPTWPGVAVVMPVRNESRHLVSAVRAVLAQDYPGELEVVLALGPSTDDTDEIAAKLAASDPRVRTVPNPSGLTPCGLNAAVAATSYGIVARVDGHAIVPRDYLRTAVEILEETGADNVGGVIETLPADGSATARAIAVALAHPFGVGNAYFRVGAREPRWVDAVSFGCYRRQVFERIGLFDEELVRNQDDEFDLRLIKHGGRVLLLPDVVASYYARKSRRQLARMYYQYGYFKPLVAR